MWRKKLDKILHSKAAVAAICFVGGLGFSEPINLAMWAASGGFCALALAAFIKEALERK